LAGEEILAISQSTGRNCKISGVMMGLCDIAIGREDLQYWWRRDFVICDIVIASRGGTWADMVSQKGKGRL